MEKRLAARAKIKGMARQTLSPTLDSTWRDLDLTSLTSAKARWAYISIYWTATGTSTCLIEWRKKGRATTDVYTFFQEVGTGDKKMSWQFLIELDDDQICQYNGAAGGTIYVYLIGYLESGRQWA